MPSGPKKRKAARRKKQLAENNNNNNNNNVSQLSTFASAVNSHSHGKEDLIHGGHKETNVEEVSSSASQDHQLNDREGTAEKQLEISLSESSIDKNKSNASKNGSNKAKKVAIKKETDGGEVSCSTSHDHQFNDTESSIDKNKSNTLKKGSSEAKKVAIEGGGTIQLERELKLEGESMSHNTNVERAEPARFPHEGGLRRRSSTEDTVQVATSTSDIDIVALHSIGSSEKENEKRGMTVMDEKTRASDVVVDKGLEKRDNKSVATSDTKISVALKDDDKLDLSYDAPAADASVHADDINSFPHDKNKSNSLKKGSNEANKVAIEKEGTIQVERELKLEGESMSQDIHVEHVEPKRFPHEGGLRRRSSSSSKPSMPEETVQVATRASDIDIVVSHSIGLSEKENDKRELGVMDEKTRVPDVLVDTGLEQRDNQVVATSDTKISVAINDDDKLDLSYDAPAVDASVHADDMNGSSHDHQTPVTLVPRPVKTTSWKSCCGLFEVFAGSNK